VNLTNIRLDGGTQPRTAINEQVVAEYADAMRAGVVFPPLTVFFDGADYWLADGFHRWHAYKASGATVSVDCRSGTRRDAVLYAVGANGTHGLRRTRDDKRRAVRMLLEDAEWGQWSDREIAKRCDVDHKTVGGIRRELAPAEKNGEIPHSFAARKSASKLGKEFTKDTSGVRAANKARAEPPITPAPPAKPKSAAELEREQAAEDAYGDTDPLDLLESMQKQIEELTALVSAAEADDLKAEAVKWRRAYDHACRQQSEEMGKAKAARDREARTMKQLRRCGKPLGVEDPDKIAPAVEAFVREHKAVAA
jgi:hypothetical protein